jgi:hypothetical protein
MTDVAANMGQTSVVYMLSTSAGQQIAGDLVEISPRCLKLFLKKIDLRPQKQDHKCYKLVLKK